MSMEIIEIETRKPFKHPRIAMNGYLYHFHKKCSHHLRWKCNKVFSMKCPSILKTTLDVLDLQFLSIDHDHVHDGDQNMIDMLKLKVAHENAAHLDKL